MARARRRILALTVAALSALTVPGAARAADVPIQPGAPITTPVGGCTLNFVFADGAKRYIGTAGHCANGVGDRIAASTVGLFGTVVYRVNSGTDDFSLIKIDNDKLGSVSPAVRSIGGPTGSTVSTETTAGDLIELHGFGMGFSTLPATRTRPGILAADTDRQFFAEIPAIFGDSGGPVVHGPTGKALGVVSGIGVTFPPSTLLGTTIERVLVLLHQAGFPVSLVTA